MRRRLTALALAALATVRGCDFSETTRNAFFPPKDLYDPLGKVQVDLSDTDSRHSVDVVHNYPGTYAVSIEVPVTQAYEFPLRASFCVIVTVEKEGTKLLEQHVNRLSYPFRNDDVGGYSLAYYEVPDDVPRNAPVTVTLTVTEPDPEFSARFDAVTMYVRKQPDL